MKFRTTVVAGLAALAASGGVALTSDAPVGAQGGCIHRAFPPTTPEHHQIEGRAEQRNEGGCREVDYEILVKIDVSIRPDTTVATVRGRGTNFSDVARGRCGPPTGHETRGFYTELRINGTNVAQSERVHLDGCRA